jgi:hypothetical protein
MFESERDTSRTPTAGEILSLHTEHRRGLHTTPIAGCAQCVFSRLDEDAPAAGAMDEPASKSR